MNADPGARALQKAYRLLALRGHSEAELRDKLRKGGFAEAVIAPVLSRCRELGYLDDGKFARQRARELAVNRLLGDRRIAADLRGKGIPEELCREAIAAAREEITAEEALGRLLGRRAKGAADGPPDERDRGRMLRSLMGKGFPPGLIAKALKINEEDGFHGDDGE
jgi:regulatory protein